MFNAKLYNFQKQHEEKLLSLCADYRELVLSAPTGSGKTVLVCKFIDDFLDENPNTIFLWLCPGAGGLHEQSLDSFKETTSGIPYGDVYDFITEPTPAGHVFFINWDKINKSSNIALRGGEFMDFMSKVLSCHNNNIEFFMIIDEEHKYKDTANEYVADVQPSHVLRISATPDTQGDFKDVVNDDDVIDAGLIATGIAVNEGVKVTMQESNNDADDLLLINLADQKRKDILIEYGRLGLNIRPLVLIQFPNGSDDWIERVKDYLSDIGYPKDSGLVASWFSGDHPDHPEEIKKLDGKIDFLLFKQAIATGWDCPRAKILVKLREGGTEKFNIQTVGRIRRMPERKHYDNCILDMCYLYTLDTKFSEGMTKSLTDAYYSYQYRLKDDAPNITLKKIRLNGADRFAVDQHLVVKAVRDMMLKKYDLNKNGRLERSEMIGFVFGSKLMSNAIEGVARTTHDMLKLNSIFSAEHQINNQYDGFIIRDAKRKIASALGVDEAILNPALKTLFAPYDKMSLFSLSEQKFEEENKLIDDMSLSEFNAFLVNNRDKLIEILSDINPDDIGELYEADLIESNWHLPEYQYYYQDKRLPTTTIFTKNVFASYTNAIVDTAKLSAGERAFEKWCEEYDAVKHYYKNGDKGDEFFSIVYKGKNRRFNFYPDYIVQLQNGDIWIIEIKGGMEDDGKSLNRDSYAEQKFDKLKEYGEEHPEIHWGFARVHGRQLYLSNTVWDENLFNPNVWKPIEVFI